MASNQIIDTDPSITLITQDDTLPNPPALDGLVQNLYTVMAVVLPPGVITTNPISRLRLYRATVDNGPWELMDDRQLSDISLKNNLFDLDPNFGSLRYYVATSVDSTGAESGFSASLGISAAYTTT